MERKIDVTIRGEEKWRLPYERLRLTFPIERKKGFLEPRMVETLMVGRIQSAIENAPDEKDLTGHKLQKYSIVFRPSEDSHFLPLLEALIFCELVDYTNKNGPDKIVSKRTLTSFDPFFPRIVRKIDGVAIRGETTIEHELAHFFQAQSEGLGKGYIRITFFKRREGNQEVLGHEAYYTFESARVSKQVRVALAPRYPSEDDLKRYSDSFYKTFPNIFEYFFARSEFRKIKARKQLFRGEIVDLDTMHSLLMYQWKELRKNEINFWKQVMG